MQPRVLVLGSILLFASFSWADNSDHESKARARKGTLEVLLHATGESPPGLSGYLCATKNEIVFGAGYGSIWSMGFDGRNPQEWKTAPQGGLFWCHDNGIYVTHGNELMATSKTSSPVVLFEAPEHPVGLEFDDKHFYFGAINTRGLFRAPRAGGIPQQIAQASTVIAIRLDGEQLFLADYYGKKVSLIEKEGGKAKVLARKLATPVGLAVGKKTLLVHLEDTMTLDLYDKRSGKKLRQIGGFANANDSLSFRDGYYYWFSWDDEYSTMSRVAEDGGQVEILVEGMHRPTGMAFVDDAILIGDALDSAILKWRERSK